MYATGSDESKLVFVPAKCCVDIDDRCMEWTGKIGDETGLALIEYRVREIEGIVDGEAGERVVVIEQQYAGIGQRSPQLA
jgi:hypothetical protein